MLLDCRYTRKLWSGVEEWIRIISNNDYNLTDRRKILGDLENNATINIIILNTKKVLYLCKLDKREPQLLQVQLNVKKVYNHDLYKFSINNKQILFEKNGLYCSTSFSTISKLHVHFCISVYFVNFRINTPNSTLTIRSLITLSSFCVLNTHISM